MIRYILAASAGATALNTFLLAYPGDLVPQGVLLAVGAAAAVLAAVGAFLMKPEPPAPPMEH